MQIRPTERPLYALSAISNTHPTFEMPGHHPADGRWGVREGWTCRSRTGCGGARPSHCELHGDTAASTYINDNVVVCILEDIPTSSE